MAKFAYTAKNKIGKRVKGIITAPDRISALEQLKKNGLLVLLVKPSLKALTFASLTKKISLLDKMNFTKQLAVMIKSGLPLLDSLEVQATQTINPYFQQRIYALKESVKSGSSLADSLRNQIPALGEVYIAMVEAGEKSGQLDRVLERLGQMLEKDYELIAKIKGAFYYPIFILVVLVLVITFILIFVIPQLKTIFEEAGASLPFLTRALIFVSGIFSNYIWLLIAAAIVTIFSIRYILKIPVIVHGWHAASLRLPIFGRFYQKIYLERFARTFASLINAGIPILEVINTTTKVVNNSVYQKELMAMRGQVERGQALSEAMAQQKHFPPVVSNLFALGEKTGQINAVAEDLADFYGKEIDQTAKNLSSLLEPMIMVIMAVGIGLVVAAVIMPIYSLIGANA